MGANIRGNSKVIHRVHKVKMVGRIHTRMHANTANEQFAELGMWCFDEPDCSECDI